MDEVECRACGESYDRYDIRCPSCGTVTRVDRKDEGGGACRLCRIFGGAAIVLAVIWMFVLLGQMP